MARSKSKHRRLKSRRQMQYKARMKRKKAAAKAAKK
ncbi:MAG: aminopeptidase [Deltaproteobacteria bacterium]|nr:aminopeptidase [Deltaproteobacteria bacterium]